MLELKKGRGQGTWGGSGLGEGLSGARSIMLGTEQGFVITVITSLFAGTSWVPLVVPTASRSQRHWLRRCSAFHSSSGSQPALYMPSPPEPEC